MRFTDLLLLMLGGGAGTVARWAVGQAFAAREWNTHFPWHTFAINAAGSFALGGVAVLCKDRPEWRLLLGVGFCGGFTTFSTFAVETVDLLAKDRPGAAAGYVMGSVLAAVAGAWAAGHVAGGR